MQTMKSHPRLQDKKALLHDMVRDYMKMKEYDQLVTTLMSTKSLMDEDCEDMLVNFFKGAWYLLSKLQVRCNSQLHVLALSFNTNGH